MSAFGARPVMSGSKFAYPGKAAAAPVVTPLRTGPALPANSIVMGAGTDAPGDVGFDLGRLVDGRLLIQATSGAGKSFTLRRILEQTAGAIQQVIFDPEDEFGGLGERFGHLVVKANLLDPAGMSAAAERIREHRLSVVFDLSDLEREGRMLAVAAAITALVEAPREHWHPCLVAIDEAHLFAPHGGTETPAVRKASTAAVTDIMSRGRKRGLLAVLATQRLARMATSVSSEAVNVMIGRNVLDRDIRRAAETIGWDARRGIDRLPGLEAGEFVAVGPAFTRSPAIIKVGAVQTRHRGATPALTPVTQRSAVEAAELLGLASIVEGRAVPEERFPAGLRTVRAFIRDPAFADSARAFEILRGLAPQGAAVGELAAALSVEVSAAAAALALLDQYGVLEFTGEGAGRAVRVAPGLVL